ncbi:MAG: hypothetical protein RMJ98_04365 [Myxococcales bacterium]|nr:hypothetical protein [Polyangiaceae bacterium]MDW8248525.1 hypothetical protein [Myxococcales bacterium]
MKTTILPLLSLFALALAHGCSAEEESPPPSPPRTPPLDPGEIELKSSPFTLQPGEEKYYCYTMRLPENTDTVVTRLRPIYGQGTHHILFSKVLTNDEPEGFSECPVLFKQTWVPLYAAGALTTPLTMPEGVAIKLAPGQQIVMQLHLQNATGNPITDTTSMRMLTRDPTLPFKPAGIFGLDNRILTIPARSEGSALMSCSPGKELDVFGFLGHMHKMGTKIRLSRGETPGQEILFEEKWLFDEQPILPLSVKIAATDKLHLECTWYNRLDKDISYGESSDTEMCAVVLYHSSPGELDGCIKDSSEGAGGSGGGGNGDACKAVQANEVGIGAPCTKGGKECASGLSCTQDLDSSAPQGFCMKLGCKASSDCGSGATCCAPKAGGGVIKTCLPAVCKPDDCTNVD